MTSITINFLADDTKCMQTLSFYMNNFNAVIEKIFINPNGCREPFSLVKLRLLNELKINYYFYPKNICISTSFGCFLTHYKKSLEFQFSPKESTIFLDQDSVIDPNGYTIIKNNENKIFTLKGKQMKYEFGFVFDSKILRIKY